MLNLFVYLLAFAYPMFSDMKREWKELSLHQRSEMDLQLPNPVSRLGGQIAVSLAHQAWCGLHHDT